jgi:hypothetical protein
MLHAKGEGGRHTRMPCLLDGVSEETLGCCPAHSPASQLKRFRTLCQAVSETGSCIFYPSKDRPGEWIPDDEWRERLSEAVGEPTDAAPEERQGKLWDVFRELSARGLQLDARGYTCSFRVVPRGDEEEELLEVSLGS